MVADVPKVCRAAPAINIGPDYKIVCREDYPVPTPGEGELLVELKMSGVCQSDHHQTCGDWGIPMAPGVDCTGHEGAGVVAAVGPGVTKFKVGDRVGITPVAKTCETCDICKSGNETLCPERKYVAMNLNGTYTQYPIIPAQWAIPLPDNVPWEQLAPFMCSGGTAYTAVKAAALRPGQYVAVMGAGGGVGHMVTQFAAAQDFNVIGIDIGAEKEATVLGSGGKHFINLAETSDLTEKVKELTGGAGVNAVIVTAGSGKAYAAAPALLAPLGTLVAVGLPPAGTAIAGTEPAQLCFLGVKIRGILVTTRADMADALTYLAAGKVKEHVTLLPFSAFPQALADVAASRTKGRFVIDFNKD